MIQKKIFIPTTNAESWRPLLADPKKHWNNKRSAQKTAISWEKDNNIPESILKGLATDDNFKDIELLLAMPEFKVPLPGGNRASQNDVFFLASNTKGLMSCAVEAKETEDFDKTIDAWYNDPSEGKQERLLYLLDKIKFPENFDKSKLRYQLFHRLASAIIMAEKFHAKYAVMLIQSFEDDDKKNHFNDFQSFVSAYGITPVKDRPLKLTETNGIEVYTLWVNSK